MPPEPVLIDVRNLRFRYQSVAEFELYIEKFTCDGHSPIGVYGPGGSGKSTFGRLLAGILKPQDGTITVSLNRQTATSTALPVTYLPQLPEEIFLGLRVIPAIETILGSNHDPAGPDHFRQLLDEFKLDYRKLQERYGFELSGGELRKVALAFGFARSGAVLIFDEPTIALSPEDEAIFDRIVTQMALRKTLICISHDFELLHRHCGRMLVFKQGRILFDGPESALRNADAICHAVGLDLYFDMLMP